MSAEPLAGQFTASAAPVRTYPAPDFTDYLLTEKVDVLAADYQALPLNSRHPDHVRFPSHILLRQDAVNWQYAVRVWGKPDSSEDWYNYAIKFSSDSADHPVYVRQYTELRESYARRANGSVLQTVHRVVVTGGGTGYSRTSPPTVSFSGGAGSGAAATAVVNASGVVTAVVITATGSGYTSAPAVAIAAPTSGTTATATAYLQGSGLVLVSEEAQPFPSGHPMEGLFLSVTRAYMTLPGPTLASKRFNRFGGLDTINRRTVAASTTPTNTTWTVQELQAETAAIATLIETVIAAGSSVVLVENTDPSVPGSRHTVTYSLVLASATVPDDTATEVYETLEYPDNPLLRVLRKSTYSIPEDANGDPYTSGNPLVEYQDGSMSFPRLQFWQAWNDSGTTREARSSFSVVVPLKIETYFTTSEQVITPFQIIEDDLLVYSMSVSGLMDDGDFFTKTGYATLTVEADGSGDIKRWGTPERSTYVDMVDDEDYIIVGGSSTIWRGGIYKTMVKKVKVQ